MLTETNGIVAIDQGRKLHLIIQRHEDLMATRTFLIGVLVLFCGAQLRAVDTFVLNEKVTKFVNRRIKTPESTASSSTLDSTGLYDSYPSATDTSLSSKRRITPPRWIGWPFLSIGSVLVLCAPLFRG
jgi:hypothetical protein